MRYNPLLWRQAHWPALVRMKKISCHNLVYKLLSFFFVVFGFWTLYINLRENDKNDVIIFPIIFIVFFLTIFIQLCKKIQFDENVIIYRNLFLQKKIINIQEIENISFSRANAEKYVYIKINNKNIKIEYSNKKIKKEFEEILQKVLTFQQNELKEK